MDSDAHIRTRRVLIAHQSTIPHYRVRFYELLEQARPREWSFDVVYDCRETQSPRIFPEHVDHGKFAFPILDTRTSMIWFGGHKLLWQHFFARAREYDVIVTDTHMSNLTYGALHIYRLLGKRRVLWGHPRDMNVEVAGLIKRAGERLKRGLVKSADHFLAYSESGQQELLSLGYPAARITVVCNTIDTESERDAFTHWQARRDETRRALGVTGKRVILYVGRLRQGNRLDFLLDSFSILHAKNPQWHLLVVGGGEMQPLLNEYCRKLGPAAVTAFGPVVEGDKLAPIFTASDLFVMPGQVGLAPLQALCYDLPVVAFALQMHGPEFEYLTPENSVILPRDTTPERFAAQAPEILARFASPESRDGLYDSIRHLTLQAMVESFIDGINTVVRGISSSARTGS